MTVMPQEGSYRLGRRRRPPLAGFGDFEGSISETPVFDDPDGRWPVAKGPVRGEHHPLRAKGADQFPHVPDRLKRCVHPDVFIRAQQVNDVPVFEQPGMTRDKSDIRKCGNQLPGIRNAAQGRRCPGLLRRLDVIRCRPMPLEKISSTAFPAATDLNPLRLTGDGCLP